MRVIVALLSLLLAVPAHAASYWIGKTNCLDAGAGSQAQPFCTPQIGVNKLVAGDTLTILDGVYSTTKVLIKTSGTADKPITIQGQSRNAILDAAGKSWSEYGIIHVQGKSYIKVKSLTLTNSPWYGMQVSGSKFITVDNVLSKNHRMSGFVFDQLSSDLVLSNSEVTNVGLCEKTGGNCAHEAVTFSNVTRFKAFGNHVHDSGREGMDAKDSATDGEMFDNHVHHMSQVGMYLNHALRIKFYRNNVHHCAQDGFMLGVGDWAEQIHDTSDNQLYQNLSWANGATAMVFWRSNSTGPIKNNLIYNNVFWGNRYEAIDNQNLPTTQFTGNVFRNNIIGKNGTDKPSSSTANGNVWDHNLWLLPGSGYPGTLNVFGDPLFVDAVNGNFQLKAGSPAIDKGAATGLPFSGTALDIGRWEFGTVVLVDAGLVPRDATVLADARVPAADAGVCMCPCPCAMKAARRLTGVPAASPPVAGSAPKASAPADWWGALRDMPKGLLGLLLGASLLLGLVLGVLLRRKSK